MTVLGLDIGGANLKAASANGQAYACEFAIWKTPERLEDELRRLLARFPQTRTCAVTMTAELADCFDTKADGVRHVVQAVQRAAEAMPVYVWHTTGEFVDATACLADPLPAAASNWHALATWAARRFEVEQGVLLDIGSTTADIIPLTAQSPVPAGLTDCARLQSGELVYTGVRRTPLCGLAAAVPYRGGFCPLAAEWFATTHDVYLLLGDLREAAGDCETADGRPATVEMARGRLARMLCCDRTTFTGDDATAAAQFLAAVQQQVLATALDRVAERQSQPWTTAVVSGSGDFLAERAISASSSAAQCRTISLAGELSPEISESACAFAVAALAAERFPAG